MLTRNRLLPREGFSADSILTIIRHTALNPALLLPLILLARFTKKGQDAAVRYPNAVRRLRHLLCFALVRTISAWFSDCVRNNWTSDKYDWNKEIVLVTGGAGGIGGAIVRILEAKGINVVVLDVQPMSFTHSLKVKHFLCDIRSPEQLSTIADQIRAQVGHPTVLINNAGVARGRTLLDSTPGDIRFTFDVNTLSHFWTTKEFLPEMIRRDHGMVVTVSSYASWLTIPNMVDYGASKAAALAFHEGLTAELATSYNARKIRTVIVHPGHTTTALFKGYDQKTSFMMPEQQPESIAEAVVGQVLAGRSGTVIQPPIGSMLASLRAMPDWHQHRVRAKGQSFMKKWEGRQVIEDVDALVDSKASEGGLAGESTVFVPEHSK